VREYSMPALVDVAESATLPDVVFRRAAQEPDVVMLRKRTGSGWQDITAAQFKAEVCELAKGLIAARIEPGDRIGLMARTRYEWTVTDYAIWTAGAVTVPIYETSSAEQVDWILSDSGARAVFAETPEHAATISQLRDRLDGLADVWLLDSTADLVTAGAGISDAQLSERRASRSAADLATIIYTSGTTGRPKGCELTHCNLLSGVRNAVEGALTEIFDMAGSTTMLFLPLAHSFARIIQIGCLESGAVLAHWPDVGTMATGITECRPSFLLAVPRVFEKVYTLAERTAAERTAKQKIFTAAAETAIAWSRAQDPGEQQGLKMRHLLPGLKMRHALYDRLVYRKLRAALGGNVRYAVSGGAPLGERLGHFFRGIGITVLEGYGLTETSACGTVNRPSRNKIGTVGLPLPGVTVRIADDGEILLSGPPVFARYWRNPAATAEVLDSGGSLRTGDIGTLDESGFLSVTGRKKELIVTATGKNVAPAVLEDRLRAHALVSQCIVVGDNRPYVASLVTVDTDSLRHWNVRHGKPADASPADLATDAALIAEIQAAVDEANKAVSRAESIRRFAILPCDFTEAASHLTPSLKVRRSNVLADFKAEIDALYS
jgi:long-chain acyl-CoA synthetase